MLDSFGIRPITAKASLIESSRKACRIVASMGEHRPGSRSSEEYHALNLQLGLERLNVGSLPALGTLHDVELHGLAFLQALETA